MKEFLIKIFDIRLHSDFQKTFQIISDGVLLKGYNLWILVCSCILASIGLNTNSTAIIIGAMLISPLMSPILGVGLSIAIHDRELLARSLRNLGLAVLISLFTSVLYFLITPLTGATEELQSRTFPTLLDVLVALFGGIAGIVAISRKEPTNAIPGVAIATALMPPLCTAGYGLATLRWNYFFGAFYLFFINAVFISLATYLIVKYLHFPEKKYADTRLQKVYSIWFSVIIIVVLIPSIYFLYSVYKKSMIKIDVNDIVINTIQKNGNEVLKWEIQDQDSVQWVKVYHSGEPLSDSLKAAINNSLHKHNLRSYALKAVRVNLTKEDVSKLSAQTAKEMFQQLQLDSLKQQINNSPPPLSYKSVSKEIQAAFSFVDTASNGWITLPDSVAHIDTIPAVFYRSKKPLNDKQKQQLYTFLKLRFNTDTVALYQQNELVRKLH